MSVANPSRSAHADLTNKDCFVPTSCVILFDNSKAKLPWSTLAAIPEMLQTAHGSLTVGLNAQPGESILIRGGARVERATKFGTMTLLCRY